MSASPEVMQDRILGKRYFFGAHPSVALGIILIVVALSLGDTVEIIPLFAPLVASSFFPFFHEIHDLLAVVVVLYAAYKYQARLGVAAILLYLTAHIPYVIVQFPGDAAEILRIIVVGFVAIFGIWLINQLHKTGTLVRQTQEHLQFQVERMPIGLIVWDTNFRVQSWNPAAESIFGFSCEEALEKHPYDLIVPKGAQPQVDDVWQRLLEGDMTAHSINDNTTKDGRTILCDWLNTPLRGDDGQVLGVLSMVQDITESKLAEERIAHLTTVLRAIRNVNQLITREKDRQSLIQKSCDLLVQRQGYERAWMLLLDENRNSVTAVGTGFDENTSIFLKQLETGNYPICVRELLGQEQAFIAYDQPGKQHQGCVLADEHSSRGVFRYKLEYGGKLYGIFGVALSSGVVPDKEEQGLFIELCGDVAFALANIEGKEKWRAAERRYQTAIQTSIDGFLVVDTQGRFVDVNNAYCQLTGYSRKELLAMSTQDTEVVETPVETAQHIQRILEKGGDRFETRHKCRDGRIVDLDVSVNRLGTEGLMFAFVRDITERKKTEKELSLNSERYRVMLKTAMDGVWRVDLQGRITEVNDAYCEMSGYSEQELLTMSISDLEAKESAKDTVARIQNIITVGQERFTTKHRRKDGSVFEVEISVKYQPEEDGSLVVFLRDVTEHNKLLEQLMAQDRLVSIGQLVSGVAHEINNPMTSVVGFSDLLLQRDLPPDIKSDVEIINSEAKRTTKIVQNLLTFSRQRIEGKILTNIQESIDRVLTLRSHEEKVNNIQAKTQYAPELPQIVANSAQLQQVFFNLIVNAEQAMLQAHNKGNLTITTEKMGNNIRISFADDGLGINPENMNKLFTPFFTTKEVGKGTGLGLSISHGIIKDHGGRMYAESKPGKGATFVVELPITNVSMKEQANG